MPLKDLPAFESILVQFGVFPLLGVLGGALFTAILQSSSAFAGVIIAISMKG